MKCLFFSRPFIVTSMTLSDVTLNVMSFAKLQFSIEK